MVAGKILKEPLLHFLIAGVVIFAAYSAIDQSPASEDGRSIEVGNGQRAQLFETFSRTWQRPPTEAELNALIEGYVKEEVFYREGREMGLDQDDAIFRRRMQQKLEFLLEPSAEELTPTSDELAAYFKAHSGRYDQPAKISFHQIFFNSPRPGDDRELAARTALASFAGRKDDDWTETLGDATMLPSGMDLTDTKEIAAVFGHDFVVGVLSASEGRWSGPFRSAYGIHLVYIDRKIVASPAALPDVLQKVQSDWESDRRREFADRRYAEMKSKYNITISKPADEAATVINISGVK
jgi:hypothetical protein